MSVNENPYLILGLTATATDEEVKLAYRSLAKKWHPDYNPNNPKAANQFRLIKAAYDHIVAERRRAEKAVIPEKKVDRFSSGWATFMNKTGGKNETSAPASDDFTTATVKEPKKRGLDRIKTVEIGVSVAAQGGRIDVPIEERVFCADCSGSGFMTSKSHSHMCYDCAGTGVKKLSYGLLTVQAACDSCSGTGKSSKTPCLTCNQSGYISDAKTFKLDIPKASRSGDTVIVPNHGEQGTGGGDIGDMIVTLKIVQDQNFRPFGDSGDIETLVDISAIDSLLGGRSTVLCPDGSYKTFAYQSGVQFGEKIRIKLAGLPPTNSEPATDLIVRLRIIPEKNLTQLQRALLLYAKDPSKSPPTGLIVDFNA